jgi:hypothetical protein
MSDLVARLRAFIKEDYAVERPQMRALCNEAADEIERLTAERGEALQGALTLIQEVERLRMLLTECRWSLFPTTDATLTRRIAAELGEKP